MKIVSVTDPAFKPYGKVLEGYDTAELTAAMEAIPLPGEGTAYEPAIGSLEACGIFGEMSDSGSLNRQRKNAYITGTATLPVKRAPVWQPGPCPK